MEGRFPAPRWNMRFTGVREVMNTLGGKLPVVIRGGAIAAMWEGGNKLKEYAHHYIPIDTSAMVDSAELRVFPSKTAPSVSLKYGASYAPIVHDDPSKRHGADYNARYGAGLRRPQEQYNWVGKAIEMHGTEMKELVSKRIWKDVARVCKSPSRFGFKHNPATLQNLRSGLAKSRR